MQEKDLCLRDWFEYVSKRAFPVNCRFREWRTVFLHKLTLRVSLNDHDPQTRIHENFYHGFVPGLIAELRDRYVLTSNRESGLGRYDVMLKPQQSGRIMQCSWKERGTDLTGSGSMRLYVRASGYG